MLQHQWRWLAFGLPHSPSYYRCSGSIVMQPSDFVLASCRTSEAMSKRRRSKLLTGSLDLPPGAAGTWSPLNANGKVGMRVGAEEQKTLWGSVGTWATGSRDDYHHQRQRQPQARRKTVRRMSENMSTFGDEDTQREKQRQDDLLAALREEIVWQDEDEDELLAGEGIVEGGEELDEARLGRLGIEILDDEDTAHVREQLQRGRGTLFVDNQQQEYEVDVAIVEDTMRKAMEVLGCQAWDVGVVLTTDEDVSKLNSQYRGMHDSTDILSFPAHDMSSSPGALPKVRFPAEMDLGDMFVSMAYVDRQMARDKQDAEAARCGMGDGEVDALWWDKERGVSGAMSKVFDLQERVSILLIHGLIHLLGYDHETEPDYKAMVELEETVLSAVFDGSSPRVRHPR